MLVLSRKQDQTVVVDNRITITVLKIRGNTVRLGIDAPLDVPIRRGELVVDLPAQIVEFKNSPGNGNARSSVQYSVLSPQELFSQSPSDPSLGPVSPRAAEGY